MKVLQRTKGFSLRPDVPNGRKSQTHRIRTSHVPVAHSSGSLVLHHRKSSSSSRKERKEMENEGKKNKLRKSRARTLAQAGSFPPKTALWQRAALRSVGRGAGEGEAREERSCKSFWNHPPRAATAARRWQPAGRAASTSPLQSCGSSPLVKVDNSRHQRDVSIVPFAELSNPRVCNRVWSCRGLRECFCCTRPGFQGGGLRLTVKKAPSAARATWFKDDGTAVVWLVNVPRGFWDKKTWWYVPLAEVSWVEMDEVGCSRGRAPSAASAAEWKSKHGRTPVGRRAARARTSRPPSPPCPMCVETRAGHAHRYLRTPGLLAETECRGIYK